MAHRGGVWAQAGRLAALDAFGCHTSHRFIETAKSVESVVSVDHFRFCLAAACRSVPALPAEVAVFVLMVADWEVVAAFASSTLLLGRVLQLVCRGRGALGWLVPGQGGGARGELPLLLRGRKLLSYLLAADLGRYHELRQRYLNRCLGLLSVMPVGGVLIVAVAAPAAELLLSLLRGRRVGACARGIFHDGRIGGDLYFVRLLVQVAGGSVAKGLARIVLGHRWSDRLVVQRARPVINGASGTVVMGSEANWFRRCCLFAILTLINQNRTGQIE